MDKVGIIYHPHIASAGQLSIDLTRWLMERGLQVWTYSSDEEHAIQDEMPDTNLVLTLGGDGTILRVCRHVAPWSVPVLGINVGSLGFMMEVSPRDAYRRLEEILDNRGWIDERMMLQVELLARNGRERTSLDGRFRFPSEQAWHILNDVVVGRGAITRVIDVQVMINGTLLNTFKADGVIVATPTGSTGYSLSAGGPVLEPTLQEMLITPISAHLSIDTALVIPATSVVELTVNTRHEAMLSMDGQIDIPLFSGDVIRVTRSPFQSRFMRLSPPTSFYSQLSQRLFQQKY